MKAVVATLLFALALPNGGKPVRLAVSGRTMEFDGSATCVAGCQ